MGVFKLGRFLSFIPQSVVIGFVNALATGHHLSLA